MIFQSVNRQDDFWCECGKPPCKPTYGPDHLELIIFVIIDKKIDNHPSPLWEKKVQNRQNLGVK